MRKQRRQTKKHKRWWNIVGSRQDSPSLYRLSHPQASIEVSRPGGSYHVGAIATHTDCGFRVKLLLRPEKKE